MVSIYIILDEFWLVGALSLSGTWRITFDHVSSTFNYLWHWIFDCRPVCFADSKHAVHILQSIRRTVFSQIWLFYTRAGYVAREVKRDCQGVQKVNLISHVIRYTSFSSPRVVCVCCFYMSCIVNVIALFIEDITRLKKHKIVTNFMACLIHFVLKPWGSLNYWISLLDLALLMSLNPNTMNAMNSNSFSTPIL
jgi:hypothetical protein